MNYDRLWNDLQIAIRDQETSKGNPQEYLVYTKLRQPRCNRVQVFDDHLIRLSDGDSSVPQRINKDDIIEVASWAINAPDHQCSINDPDLKPARMGSIICTMLDLLDDFEYQPGQVLVYKEPCETAGENN
jgi:hypothetical protein